MPISILLLICGFAIVILGAEGLVRGASSLGVLLKVPQIVIGLTVVAFGTSTPELVVSLFSAAKGHGGIVFGNVIGSNLFNLLLILGLTAIVKPIRIRKSSLRIDIPISLLAAMLLFFMVNDRMFSADVRDLLSRSEGLILLTLFGIFLGELQVLDMKASVLDFQNKFKMGKFGIRGMIGSDLLRLFQTEIDYSAGQFTFSKPASMVSDSERNHLLDMEIILPYLPVVKTVINQSLELKAIVDTGLHFAVVIPYPYLERGDIRSEGKILECDGMFANWPFTEQNRNVLMKVGRIEIGDLVLEDQTVLFADLPRFGNQETMLLGRDFLNDYKTRLDFENLQVCLSEAPFRQEDIAFSIGTNLLRQDGCYELKGLWKGSPADSIGLKVGDKFSHVNGRSDLSGEELYWLLTNPQVKELTLTEAESGKEIKLAKRDLLEP